MLRPNRSALLRRTDADMTAFRRCLQSWMVKDYDDIPTFLPSIPGVIHFSLCPDYLDDKFINTLTDFARAVHV